MHAAAVDAHDRLGQEAGRVAHVVGNLAAQQLIKLNLIGRGYHFGIAEVDLKLAGRNFRVILLVLEAHGALHFGCRVDKHAQRIERQHVIVAAGVDEIELARLVIALLGVLAGKQEALNLSRRVQGVAQFLIQLFRVVLQHAAQVARIRAAVFIDHIAEDQHFTVAENIGRHPVESAPVDAQAQVAFLLRRESANRRAVESQVFVGAEQKLLVIVEQVQASLKIGEQDSHGLDALLVREIFEAFFTNFAGSCALGAVSFGLQVQCFKLLVGECEKIPIIRGHKTPLVQVEVWQRRNRAERFAQKSIIRA